MYWRSTAYSYLQIPQVVVEKNINQDIAVEYESFISEEQLLIAKLKEGHLNILLKIINNEIELDSREA